jgi:hypothetical protein
MEKDHLEIILEDIRSKFELVLEGHDALRKEILDAREESNQKHEHTAFMIESLNKKIDAVDGRLSKKIDEVDGRLSKKIDDVNAGLSKKIDNVSATLSKKIDVVASELAAHRADTEVHRARYGISEKKD